MIIAAFYAIGAPEIADARVLDSAFLFAGVPPTSPVNNAEFLPIDAHRERVELDGTLDLSDFQNDHYFNLVYVSSWSTVVWPLPFDTVNREYLPDFSYQYVQKHGDLIPVARGFQENTATPPYEWILSPSRCWRETDDGVYDRCALVLAVTEKGNNCVYNGLATFLVNSITLSISPVYYQFTQEYCAYYKWNNWGFADSTFTPEDIDGKGQIVANFLQEVNDHLDVKSVYDLPHDVALDNCGNHGNCNNNLNFPVWTPSNIPLNNSAEYFAVVFDGKLYQSDQQTRSGPHPYPQWVVFPSYSWAKPNFAALLAGILDYKKGCTFPTTPSSSSGTKCVFDLKVADWIPTAAARTGVWTTVTLRNLLDEASGVFNSSVYGVDEGSAGENINFFYRFTNTEKLDFAVNGFVNRQVNYTAGTLFVYHTTDTYLAATMMEAIVNKVYPNTGGIVGFHQTNLVEKLFLSPLYAKVRVTYDTTEQAFGGYGLYAYANDNARLAEFWTFSDFGKMHGKRLISSNYYKATQQMLASSRGNPTLRNPVANPNQYYHYSWWSTDFIGIYSANATLCPNPKINMESGFGGLRYMNANAAWAYLNMNDAYVFNVNRGVDALASLIGCPVGLISDV